MTVSLSFRASEARPGTDTLQRLERAGVMDPRLHGHDNEWAPGARGVAP